MNDAVAAIALGRRIDLTREADFVVGGVEVRPAACEVIAGGARIKLQPRVMQVLVALARAGGEPVSRESLTDVCWGQVAVSDDALNRCIQRLRRLAENEAEGAFIIETIPRLGYRLAIVQPTGVGVAPLARRVRNNWRTWPMVAAGLIVVGALGAAGVWVWTTRPAHWSVEGSETLVSTPLLEVHPALSPDGTMLAYSAGPTQTSGHLYLKRLSSVESISISPGPADGFPAWSPDGAQIAYIAWRYGEPCRIMVTAVPAGLPREIGRCQGLDHTALSWSAAGDALYLADSAVPTGQSQIIRFDLASGRRSAATHPPGGFDDLEPKVSPDGRWLLYSRNSFLPDQIVIQDLRTRQERILARLPQHDVAGAAWAEDSKSVFVVAATPEGSGIWTYPLDGGPRGVLIGMGMPIQLQMISTARGGLLAAEFYTGRANVVRPPGRGDETPVVIDPATSQTWSPAYRADGTLVDASNRSGQAAIWLMPPGQRARLLLGYKSDIPYGLAWSPDGTKLAFLTLGAETDERVISAEGEELVKIRSPGTQTGEPAWSGDGRALLFPVRDRGGWRIWRADLARPDAPFPITSYGWCVVRTSGDTVLGVKVGLPGIWRLGPTPVELTDKFTGRLPTAFTVYKSDVIFNNDVDPKQADLLAVSVAGGPARPFASIPNSLKNAFAVDTHNLRRAFAVDPRTGTPVYVEPLDVDRDIELYHLARN
jgi:Tol biopolymer transport system component/DNA-binding winged helix-turn-helix (wHTH) protein